MTPDITLDVTFANIKDETTLNVLKSILRGVIVDPAFIEDVVYIANHYESALTLAQMGVSETRKKILNDLHSSTQG